MGRLYEPQSSNATTTENLVTAENEPKAVPGWQRPSLNGLASLTTESLPAFEIIALDGIAAFTLGGNLKPPYTIQHGSRVASAVLSAAADSQQYRPAQQPEATDAIVGARAAVREGALTFAARGVPGLNQLVNRIVSAAVGELEIHKDAPEEQVRSLFFYSLVAVASGPRNTCSADAAAGVHEIFDAWDGVIGAGFVPPWRVTAPKSLSHIETASSGDAE